MVEKNIFIIVSYCENGDKWWKGFVWSFLFIGQRIIFDDFNTTSCNPFIYLFKKTK